MKRDGWFEEYRPIGNLSQYLLHFPAPGNAPVVLYLHGGPGVSEANLGFFYRRYIGGRFTVVYWDQRAAGKTWQRNPHQAQAAAGPEPYLEDLAQVVAALKARYGREKIILLGHSWGALLGCLYARAHPQDMALYLGVGQHVSMHDNAIFACKRLRTEVASSRNARDAATLRRLQQALEAPGARLTMDLQQALARLLQRYDLATRLPARLLLAYIRCPVFRPADLDMFLGRLARANRPVIEQLTDYDLRSAGTRFALPMHFISGERDFQTAAPLARAYYEQVQAPDKSFHSIAGASHNVMFDQPEAFWNLAARLVQGAPPDGAP